MPSSFGSPGFSSRPKLTKVMPEVWKLVKPFRWLLAGSFLLMIVNRICSLAMPISSRYLINNVMYKHQLDKLPLIAGVVAGATLIQGITTYILNQQLAITGQRLITNLRMQVQQHIGRLPVSFYDENRTGALVARIMTDVEGLHNLIGTGLLDFVGGILTGTIALILLIHISTLMTVLTVCIMTAFGWFLKKAFGITRPLYRERSRINAEVSGRLTESLSAVRVVKGYHAEESEARVFAEGAGRLLENITKSITAQSFMSFCSTTVLGIVGALVMYIGAREVTAHRLDVGGYVEFIMLLAFMVAPIAMLVSVGTQLTEALAGLDRTTEILNEPEEDREPRRIRIVEPILGDVAFKDVVFAYIPDKPVLHGISFEARAGTVTALVGSSGSGKSTIISLICGFHSADGGEVSIDGVTLRPSASAASASNSALSCRRPFYSTERFARTFSSVVLRPPRNSSWKHVASRVSMSSPSAFRSNTKRSSANAASSSLAVNVSGSPSPAPSSPIHASSSSMRPPAHWTPNPRP